MSQISSGYTSNLQVWQKFLGCWREAVNARLRKRQGYSGLALLPEAVNRASAAAEESVVAIERAEQRLGVRLPASYRDFALASRGAGWIVEAFAELQAGGLVTGGLAPTHEIDSFPRIDPRSYGIWVRESAGIPRTPSARYYRYGYDADPAKRQDSSAFDADKLSRAIKIGELDRGAVILLNPLDVTKDGEMEAWILSFQTHASRFRSFAELMQYLANVDILLEESRSPFDDPSAYRGVPCVGLLKTAASAGE